MRSLRTTTKSSPRLPQLEKACAQQWRPNVVKKTKQNKTKQKQKTFKMTAIEHVKSSSSVPTWSHLSYILTAFSLYILNLYSELKSGPPKRYAHIKSLEPVNFTLFGKRVFTQGIKLRLLRWRDHPGKALHPMTCVFVRDTRKTFQK